MNKIYINTYTIHQPNTARKLAAEKADALVKNNSSGKQFARSNDYHKMAEKMLKKTN